MGENIFWALIDPKVLNTSPDPNRKSWITVRIERVKVSFLQFVDALVMFIWKFNFFISNFLMNYLHHFWTKSHILYNENFPNDEKSLKLISWRSDGLHKQSTEIIQHCGSWIMFNFVVDPISSWELRHDIAAHDNEAPVIPS